MVKEINNYNKTLRNLNLKTLSVLLYIANLSCSVSEKPTVLKMKVFFILTVAVLLTGLCHS